MQQTALDWLISVDDHVLEPPDLWQKRLPVRYRDVGPRIATDDRGEAWFFEDLRSPTPAIVTSAGREAEQLSPLPTTYAEMRPGCYDPLARVEDMNRDGVLASLCFPSFPRFCGQAFTEAKDKVLGLLCVQAYNDWMLEDWCGAAPGRFIPLMIIPLWDPQLAVKEIERTAARGGRAIAFSENPYPLGLPSIHDKSRYWDPVFAAAAGHEMPLCTHLGSSSQLPQTSPSTPLIATMSLTPLNIAACCIDWLFSGILPRFPNLKICLSEGGIGWIPYVLERCDYVVEKQKRWASDSDWELDWSTGETKPIPGSTGLQLDELHPSQLFREHMYGCFIDEAHGASCIDEIGADNVMIETDYPHGDTTYPNSLAIARRSLAKWDPETQHKVVRGNAERVFRFTPAEPPEVTQASVDPE
jgi:predicted TIM-barrel fold metal-dependent hydrolase